MPTTFLQIFGRPEVAKNLQLHRNEPKCKWCHLPHRNGSRLTLSINRTNPNLGQIFFHFDAQFRELTSIVGIGFQVEVILLILHKTVFTKVLFRPR